MDEIKLSISYWTDLSLKALKLKVYVLKNALKTTSEEVKSGKYN